MKEQFVPDLVEWDEDGQGGVLGEDPALTEDDGVSPKGDTGKTEKAEKPEPKGKAGKDRDDELAELRRERDALKRDRDRLNEESRFWQERANPKAKQARQARVEEDEDEEQDEADDDVSDADLLDDLQKSGREALRKRGFVRVKDVRHIASEIAAKAAAKAVETATRNQADDIALTRQYPDLADENSELFRLTKQHLDDARKDDPGVVRSRAALKLAVRAAAADLAAKKARSDDDGRRRRIAVQDAGDDLYGGGDDLDSGLSPMQARFAQQMGLSEKEARAAYARRK